jgi:uncharacterized OB-fold protein
MTNPAAYWRANKSWSEWLGKQGRVIGATRIRVAAPALEQSVPYSYVLADFGKAGKHEFIGAGHQEFAPGDHVKCVLRKIGESDPKSIIEYGIKLEKIKK